MKNLILLVIFGAAFCAQAQSSVEELAISQKTAFRRAHPFHLLSSENVPEWESMDVTQSRFEDIRDRKFLIYKGESRRIPWLFPKDGCHNRAALFINEAVQSGYTQPMRVFIFGILKIESPYIVGGSVEPWFHSAPIVKVEGKVYVLDPSLDYDQPLEISDWALQMTPNFEKVNFAYCSGDTYLPTSNCDAPEPMSQEDLYQDAQLYLRFEWNMLTYLGFDTEELLLQ